ncbi:MAG: helix-turn-helix transcriptional regulator [Zoogloeaceae bacterium]|jgi:HTH-type transcriptional regulator/antitoxin HipB|nr:helix-turn-helix transcriptional regulator [Zoogloeaceae bacterium]
MDSIEIRGILADRRRELGLTQAELGKRARLSREMVLRFENGGHDIGLRRLLRLASGLGLEMLVRPGNGCPVLEDLSALFGEASEEDGNA